MAPPETTFFIWLLSLQPYLPGSSRGNLINKAPPGAILFTWLLSRQSYILGSSRDNPFYLAPLVATISTWLLPRQSYLPGSSRGNLVGNVVEAAAHSTHEFIVGFEQEIWEARDEACCFIW